MKSIYNLFIYITLSISLMLSACAEAPLIDSQEGMNTSDQSVTFQLQVANPLVVQTRAAAGANESHIEQLDILVFESEQGTAPLVEHRSVTTVPKPNKGVLTFRANLGYSQTHRLIYVVANAQEALASLQVKTSTLANFKKITTKQTNAPFAMSGSKMAAIPSEKLKMPFTLQRNIAKITAEDGRNASSTPITEWYIHQAKQEGTIVIDETALSTGDNKMKSSTDGTLYCYPALQTTDHPIFAVLKIDGSYYRMEFKTKTNSSEKPLSILPNHYYQIKVKSVTGNGYATAEEATKHPNGAQGTIYDHQPTIFDMATDGTYELGVCDTVKVNADGGLTTFPVKFSEAPTANDYTFLSNDPWLNTGNIHFESKKDITLGNDADAKETGMLRTYTIGITKNDTGEDRSGHLTLTWKGLSRNIYFVQPSINLIGTLGITFQNGTDPLVSNYFELMEEVFKYSSRKRTQGLHFMVQDDPRQGTYTITLPTVEGAQWTVSDKTGKNRLRLSNNVREKQFVPSGSSFTVQWNQPPNTPSEPEEYPEGLQITCHVGGQTKSYNLNIYHTSLFVPEDHHKKDQVIGNFSSAIDPTKNPLGLRYYEVVKVGHELWLDRNLGARSDEFFSRGISTDNIGKEEAAGFFYSIGAPGKNNEVEIKNPCPHGYSVPTVSQFSKLTSQPGFRKDWQYNEQGQGYWDARLEIPQWGKMYFPKNRFFKEGSNALTGSEHAGYYWTQSKALGTSGDERAYWLQFLKIAGGNASFDRYRIQDDNKADSRQKNGMLVRCVKTTKEKENVYTIEFYVKGYTHVFLYDDPGNGNTDQITYFDTWPGKMIAMKSDGMYHVFKHTSYVKYEHLKVVFYNSQDKSYFPDNREGIPFDMNQPKKFFDIATNQWQANP